MHFGLGLGLLLGLTELNLVDELKGVILSRQGCTVWVWFDRTLKVVTTPSRDVTKRRFFSEIVRAEDTSQESSRTFTSLMAFFFSSTSSKA